uniref:Uncharacterized protein n=1 Tax=Ciona intestinalis TaxID=7719 RepID=H2XWK1_CIOIN
MTDSDTSSHEALVETVNEALDKLGELRSDDCTRLVCELHILCQRVREVTPAQVRELAKHGLKRCLRIGNVQESYHSSFLALM